MKITDSKEVLWKKIKLVESALQKQSSWYTGLSLKKYLEKNIFSLKTPKLQNLAIESGRWSVYAHYSQLASFRNLLDKNNIKYGSKVLVHPLLPSFLVEELVDRQVQIVSLDIQKSTFNFPNQEFEKFLEKELESKSFIELIIHYSFNGLYSDLNQMLLFSQKQGIPSLVIIDNYNLNLDLFKIFETLKLGGILWNFGDSFWDDQLDTVLDVDLPTQNWFISWQIETRTRTILEYHLKESYNVYLPLLEAFFYLLMDEYKQKTWFGGIYQTLWDWVFFQNRFITAEKATKSIKLNYAKIFDLAVCDLIFDLQNDFPIKIKEFPNIQQISYQANEIAVASKQIYDFFLSNLSTQKEGSLEIPSFYLDKTYLKYFVFTTESDYWYEVLQPKGLVMQVMPPLHPIFADNKNLKIAKFVTKLSLLIDMPLSIKNSLENRTASNKKLKNDLK